MFKLGTKVTATDDAPAEIKGMTGTVKHWSSKTNSAVEWYRGTQWYGTLRVKNAWIEAA